MTLKSKWSWSGSPFFHIMVQLTFCYMICIFKALVAFEGAQSSQAIFEMIRPQYWWYVSTSSSKIPFTAGHIVNVLPIQVLYQCLQETVSSLSMHVLVGCNFSNNLAFISAPAGPECVVYLLCALSYRA